MLGGSERRVSNAWKFLLAAVLLFVCLPAPAHVPLARFPCREGVLDSANVGSTVTLNLYVRGSYVYDADGNLVYVNRGNKDYTYTFDALGRLVAATLRDSGGNGWNWTATYDALNRRVQTAHAAVTSNTASSANTAVTLWDPLYPMQEIYRQDQSHTLFYLYGPDLSDTVGGLGGIGGILSYRENGDGRQVFSDMRGNVVGAADYYYLDFNPWYSAFGMNSPPSQYINTPSFATRRYDETGLIYLGARYYDQVTGRLLSPDPSRFADSRNLYALTAQDPVNKADPLGLCADSGGWNVWTRVGGLGQTAAGLFEAGVGLTFGTATAPTVAGGLAGAAIMTHGADQFQAGVRTFVTGQRTDTMSSQLIQSAGVSRNTANLIDSGASVALSAGAGYANLSRVNAVNAVVADDLTIVSRWGREGLQSSDWVMKGPASSGNYLGSFKWQPGAGNEFAPYSSGSSYIVPSSSVKWPSGAGIDGAWKGLFGLRIYSPD